MADDAKKTKQRRTSAKGKTDEKKPSAKSSAKSKSNAKPKTGAKSKASAKSKSSAGADAKPNGQAPLVMPTDLPEGADFRLYVEGGHTHEDLGLSAEDVLGMYRSMLLQRRFEERAAQMYGRQKIAGFLHLYIGQEAISTGTVWALDAADPIITAYRDHGFGLARGMSPGACMAELYGKIDGCSRGKGGSMHYFSKEHHFYGGHGIVGGQIPLAVGLAFAQKYQETGQIAAGFFGDGAIAQGAFHEAANLAALYEIPVLLVCENNQYGMGTAIERAAAEPDLYKQAYSYDMTGALVDGMDVFEVYHAIRELAEQARADNKPSLVEIRTYRYRGHSMSDPQKYRTKEEMEEKKNEDPIVRLKQYLLEHDLADAEALDELDEAVKAEVMDAVEFADNSPFPPVETMYEDVYAQEDYPFIV